MFLPKGLVQIISSEKKKKLQNGKKYVCFVNATARK